MAYTTNTVPDHQPLTFTYKVVEDVSIQLDVYPPHFAQRATVVSNGNAEHKHPMIPSVVYFHGGGLTVGNRQSWFPRWMQKRAAAAGYAFISADYRLVPPATAHDVLDDIKDVFTFISTKLNELLDQELAASKEFSLFLIDPDALAVAGTSAGGLCAYYAAMHISPKPKAVVCMYAMGGDFLTPHGLSVKTVPFLKGREILDPAQFSEFIYPFPDSLKLSTGSPLSYHPPSSPTPGYPANPRMLIGRLYLQLGVVLDYLTGEYEPSLCAALRKALGSDKSDLLDSSKFDPTNERLKQLIPEQHRALFPQFGVTPDWPPTYLAHGALDSAVQLKESRHMHRLMEEAGVDVRLNVLEDKEHSFDYEEDAEAIYGSGLFDSVGQFLIEHLEKASLRGSRRSGVVVNVKDAA